MRQFNRILLLSLLLLVGALVQAEPLNVATSEWVPYVGKQLPNQGLAIDLVKTALQRAGYQPVINIDVWSRTLQGAGVGYYDLIAAAWYSKQRAQQFAFSKPYLYNQIKILKRADSGFEFISIDDLSGNVFGVVANYAYGEEFNQLKGIIRIPSQFVSENVLAVLNGDVNLTLDDERVLKYVIAHDVSAENRANLVILPRPLSTNGLSIAVSKQNPKSQAIVQAFDKAMEAMRQDGTYDRIVKAHSQ